MSAQIQKKQWTAGLGGETEQTREAGLRKEACNRRIVTGGLVDGKGFEPSTPAMRTRCSPN